MSKICDPRSGLLTYYDLKENASCVKLLITNQHSELRSQAVFFTSMIASQ